MSTKTITKRIALATTVALGAGVLSLVSVTSAHAAAGSISINANSNTTPDATHSFGLLPGSSVTTSLAGTALILAYGQISVTAVAATGSTTTVLVVSGGTITAAAPGGPGGSVGVLSPDLSTYGVSAVNGSASILVKPNSSAPFTIYSYTGGTSTSSATGGTLTSVVVVSVTGSSTVGTVSVTNSGIFFAGTGGNREGTEVPADSTAAGIGTSTYAQYQSAMIVARDAYKQYLPANTLIQATATNGAILTLANATTNALAQRTSPVAPSVPAVSSAYVVTGFADQVALLVSAPALAPVSTVVTVTANGVVIGTKAFTFTGKVATVSLSAPTNGFQPITGGSITVAFADAAGNAVYPTSGLAKNSDGTKGAGINTNTVTYPTASTAGSFIFNCGSINSTGQVTMNFTNPGDASVVTSNAVPVTCSGSANSYTAALDKTSYNVGDLAVLTVTFKDAAGQLAADVTGAIANASNTPSIFGASLTNTTGTSTTAGTTADTTTNGVATYKFIVGATAGASRLYVDFPKVDLLNGVSQTIAYTINSAGGTSLNDVLKGIVSLIASINKQIAALAKLVTKKK